MFVVVMPCRPRISRDRPERSPVTAPRIPSGKGTWLDPTWRSGALAWVEATLSGVGRRVSGPVEQPHVRPWSTAMRIPTEEGAIWFKATGPGTAHEGPLLELFRRLGVARVVLPLAVHPERSWLLFDDAEPTLRATRPDGLGDHDLVAWERILAEYAVLQRFVERDTSTMLAVDTPDGRPERLPGELDRLLDDDRVWGLVTADERAAADAARDRLRRARGLLRDSIDALATTGIAATIQHDDLHGGNIVVGPEGDRFFDWGDAVIALPFSTLTVTFNSIAHRTGRTHDDPAFVRLRDVYLEAWTDVASRDALADAERLAGDLGCIGRALAWERSLGDLAPDQMDGQGDAVAGWLMEFAERLDGPSWQRGPGSKPIGAVERTTNEQQTAALKRAASDA